MSNLIITPPPPPEKRGPESRVAVFGWLFLCLNVFGFACLGVVDAGVYDALLGEDRWVEYLTAVLFALVGLLLFVTALAERSYVRRSIYILAGMVFLFAAGEEISWGQRILGFETPDFLLGLNKQGEFNAHNIEYRIVSAGVRNGVLLFCTMSCAAFFCRKDALYGIPLPSILLTLGFLASIIYVSVIRLEVLDGLLGLDFIFRLDSDFSKGITLILLLVIYALFSGQAKRFGGAVVTTTILFQTSAYVSKSSAIDNWTITEFWEYLFAIVCICYALELLLAQTPARRKIAVLCDGIKLPGKRIPMLRAIFSAGSSFPGPEHSPAFDTGRKSTTSRTNNPNFAKLLLSRRGLWEPWLTVCALVIICSIGLVFWQYFNVKAEVAADFAERYRSITTGTAGEPIIRSTFDAYLIGNELTYFKEPCAPADTADKFFLHLIPANVDDLHRNRRQSGFDNLDFQWVGAQSDGWCLTTIELPDYTFTGIRTGQYVPEEGSTWNAEYAVP